MPPAPSELETAVRQALEAIPASGSGAGLVSAGRIAGLVVRTDGRVGFVLESPSGQADEPLRAAAERAVRAVPGVTAVTAVLTAHSDAAPPQAARAALPPAAGRPASAIVAVASGKGGVGKSTVAVNLAVAAARSGLRVGLLDADIFGPSLPTMLGTIARKPTLTPAKKMIPVEAHGLVTQSIGYLVDPDQAVAWRGPMVMSAINQLIADTEWGDLDILFIDTPPGTGEVQLSLVQKLALDGAVIVSTPQELALADVRRGVGMFRKASVPILGVIENMAWFEMPDGSRAYPFGEGGAQRTAGEMGVPFLGALPILSDLREGGDTGQPAAGGEGLAAQAFALLAEGVCRAAAAPGKPPPRIVFE